MTNGKKASAPKGVVVPDFKAKIDHLRMLRNNLSEADFLKGIKTVTEEGLLLDTNGAPFKGAGRRTVLGWLNGKPLHISNLQWITAYFKLGLVLDHKDFQLPLEDFKAKVRTGPLSYDTHAHLNQFAGLYQIIRPHSGTKGAFIVEPFQVDLTGPEPHTWMYSHRHRSDQYRYWGSVEGGKNYFFSMLHRANHESQRSYRTLAFYVGTGVWKSCLSGIVLRGTTGEAVGKRAVAVPFLALRIDEQDSLAGATFEEIPDEQNCRPRGGESKIPDEQGEDTSPVYRLAPGSHVLAGALYENWHPTLFGFCKRIFDAAESASDGFFPLNPMVLNTLVSTHLKTMPDLDVRRWRDAVDASIARGLEASKDI